MIRRWLRLWFTFESLVSRRDYIVSGIVLAGIKYAGGVAIAWPELGHVWLPKDFFGSIHSLWFDGKAPGSTTFLLLYGIWTLPFLWIGVSMGMRRALDADRSPWLAMLFLVPILNYLFILAMCVQPSRSSVRPTADMVVSGERVPRGLIAVAAGVALGLGMIGLSVYANNNYGATLFVGTPFAIGVLTAFLLNRHGAISGRVTQIVVAMTLGVIGCVALFVAIEGVLCLAMAAPIALILGAMGAAFGRSLATVDRGPVLNVILAGFLLPASLVIGRGEPPTPLREVRSFVVIDAPADVVWRNVIAFPPLAEPNDFVFRSGIAYPRRAEIVGSGVGAVRYCVFSTGSFVEPITVWEPGRRLAFDVASQPRPMEEWSPYSHLSPQHLDGYFRSRRGEFRLIALDDGRTRLEGSTWYEMTLYPGGYWALFGDALIHQIHGRVLDHIRALAEKEGVLRRGLSRERGSRLPTAVEQLGVSESLGKRGK